MNEKNKSYKNHGRDNRNPKSDGKVSYQKGKGKGKYPKGSNDYDKSKGSSMDEAPHSYGNDPMWYAYNEQMLADAASLAFSNPLGNTVPKPAPGIPWTIITTDGLIGDAENNSIPGILTFDFVPGPGVSKDATSPLNVAAKNLYSYVRHANSGHTNYESQDLMLYIVAMDSAYTFWANMVRAYGFMATYAQSNRYLARTLIEALGFDFDSLENNLADFRAYINLYAYKLGSICVPSHMSYVSRHIWMVSHVWVDSTSKKSQMYAYVPYNFWELNEVGSAEGAVLNLVRWGTWPSKHTFANMREIGNTLIGRILESEDMMIMSGDILKAFGAENLFTVSSIAEGFYLVPEYSEEVCMQIQNLTAWGPPPDSLQIKSEVSTGILRYEPMVEANLNATKINQLFLNVRKNVVSPSDVMVATRCMSLLSGTAEVAGKVYRTFDSLGSEFIANMVVHTLMEATSNHQLYHNYYVAYSVPTNLYKDDVETWQRALLFAVKLEKFDWHPYVYLLIQDSASEAYTNGGTLGDFDNYTTVNAYELSKMNETALLSEFACPTMGAYVLANRK